MHSLYRFLTTKLVLNPVTYLPGMLLVRLSRRLKKRFVTAKKDFITIGGFMGGIKMRVDKNSYMGGSIYWCGFHHINELLFLRNFLKSDMVFVDVGANQGEFSLYASSILTKGKVIAFEPTSFQLGLLKENVDLNQFRNIQINNFGLYDKSCQLKVYTSNDIELHSGFHEGLSTLFKSDARSEVEEIVDLKVFDEIYLDELERIDFIKMDIEGAELYALKGMIQSLKKFRPLVVVELNQETFNNAGYNVEDIITFFNEIDYSIFKLFRGRKSSFEPKEENIDFGNFLFIPSERSNESF